MTPGQNSGRRNGMSSSTVKTAISLDGGLFREAQGLARRMKVSRSRLFATAMEEFIERRRNRELLDAMNAACEAGEKPSEEKLRQSLRVQHRRLVQGQW
jgi:metal-responsive CopG/Arc/MetJ family transcriptional regulator